MTTNRKGVVLAGRAGPRHDPATFTPTPASHREDLP